MIRWPAIFIAAALFGSCLAANPTTVPARADRQIGIDSNYALDMAARKRKWSDEGRPAEPLSLFAKQGVRHARIRLWVGQEGMNQLDYATRTARAAQQAELKPYLVIFLSDDWADLVKQPVPAAWKDLTADKKAEAVKKYAEAVVRHLAGSGVAIDTFEIGNEIDFGICGEFETEWPKRISIAYMEQNIWPRMVPIIKAAQAGVLKAQPKGKFILHLAQWNNADYCIAFWKAMTAADVRLDYAGLSYFPTSAEKPEQRRFQYLQREAARIVDALHRPVLLCETAYPAADNFGGQFASWNHPAEGYPLTESGQARWLADLLAIARSDRNIAGAYYWSPEWYDGGLWDAFALFNGEGQSRPALRSFLSPATRPATANANR